jgi:hypothetical protein
VFITKPVSVVEPEKNPLSSASLLTTPLISVKLLSAFKGFIIPPVWFNKNDF